MIMHLPQLTEPFALSRLASDATWGLMLFQKRGATPEAVSNITSGIVLCDVVHGAVHGDIGASDDAVSELQSHLIMGSKLLVGHDANAMGVLRQIAELLDPIRASLENLVQKGRVVGATEWVDTARESFGRLAVRFQDLGL